MILNDIENYLVIEDGIIKDSSLKQDIEILDHKVIIKEDAKLQIIYNISKDCFFEIVVNENIHVDLIEMYKASRPCSFKKKLIALDNSTMIRYVENTSNINENIEIDENVEIYQDAAIRCAYVELENYSTVSKIKYDLLKPGANANLRLASLSQNQAKKNYEITLHHKAPNTYGDMDNYGLVQSKATLIIDGIGRIDKGNFQSNTHQTNKILVLDPRCVAKANPYLYIDEHDVKASHGASVGKIDEDHLYYLQSRGLSLSQSMHLVTYGYFLPVLEFITVDSLKDRFSQILKDKVGL